MNETEMRTIQQNTEALYEHTQAINRLTGLLSAIFATPDNGVRSMDTIFQNVSLIVEQLHSNTSRNFDIAEAIQSAANKISCSAELMEDSARKSLTAAEGMSEASRQNCRAADGMDEASRRMRY